MKSLPTHFALLLTLLVCSTGQCAELLLRERATQHGAIVRLGDIADIAGGSPAEVQSLANTPLLPSPAPGTHQFLTVAQLRDLLVARGVRGSQLTIQGARTVELGASQRRAKFVRGSMVRGSVVASADQIALSRQAAEVRVRRAIEQTLQNSTATGRWRVEVSLNESQVTKLSGFGSQLEARGQQRLRSGRQRFQLTNGSNDQDLFVSANITQIRSVVVVRQSIERGNIVRASDVELLEREGNLPNGSMADLGQVVGQVAQRALRPETVLLKNHLRAVWQVRRGETVSVFVRTGGIVVRTRAVAKQDGAMGDLISVEMLADKQRLNVSVSGPGEVAIHATGGQTTEYASLNRSTRRR